jgi:hypothetical protein
LDVVSPDYFELDALGGLKYTKLPDPLLVASMHAKSITVTPFLSNHWNRAYARAMLERRVTVAFDLAQAVTFHGLDGLDIDIQNINESDRAAFTDFVRLVREALPPDRTLTVCVAANPYNTNVGWQGGYDYAALAGYCDHVFMMTYDESYEGSEPGPVASMRFIEDSIKYGLKHVPPEKLMVGIPFYGRYWTATSRGLAFTLADIEYLVSHCAAETTYDSERECANSVVTIPDGASVTTWGGKKVTAGVYNIWYDNARSFGKKLALVRKYGIKGVGSWALGQEPPYVWDSYASWLYGDVFTDIKNHWAQSYIIKLRGIGVINGRTPELFVPEGNLTRAEAAAMLVRLSLGDSISGGTAFSDTAAHWARDYIAAARDAQLVTGVTDSVFSPDRLITREEFAVMAERYTNLEDTVDMTQPLYTDVSADTHPWSNSAITLLSINNVLSGYDGGVFRPGEPITRAEAAKVISLLRALPTRFLSDRVLPLNRPPMGPR